MEDDGYNPFYPMVREIPYDDGKEQPNFDPMALFDRHRKLSKPPYSILRIFQ